MKNATRPAKAARKTETCILDAEPVKIADGVAVAAGILKFVR